MKKKLKIASLKAENAELKEKVESQQELINFLMDEKEETEKKMISMQGELHAYEVVHTGHM